MQPIRNLRRLKNIKFSDINTLSDAFSLDAQGDFLYSPSRKMQHVILSFIIMEGEQAVEALEEVVADR